MKDLKALRIMRGLTMGQVATAIGTSKQRYSQIEQGNSGITREKLMRKIAKFYGIDVFELLGSDVLRIKPKTPEEEKSLLENVLRND